MHPLLTDFPAAFLPISVVLNLLSRRWSNFRQPAWITMIIGTVGAILAAITGDAHSGDAGRPSAGACPTASNFCHFNNHFLPRFDHLAMAGETQE